MKALIIDSFDFYKLRSRYVYDGLKCLGYDVSIITSDFNHITKSKQIEERENVLYISTKPYKKNISLRRIKSHLDFAKQAIKIVYQENPDIIYCLVPLNSLVKNIAKYKRLHYTVQVFFDVIDLWPESMPTIGMIKKILFPWRLLRDKYLSSADKVFLECEYYKQYLPKSIKYSVMYLSKEERIVNYNSDEVLRFLYLGSINNIIDINCIVELLALINKKRLIHLEIIGGGEKSTELTLKLDAAGVQYTNHGIIFDENTKDEIISRCQFGLNMYKKGLCIGLTMKSIDYFSRGLPIVSNNIYDTDLIIDRYQCGISITKEGFASTIEKLSNMTDKEWMKMHENAMHAYSDLFIPVNTMNEFKLCVKKSK